MAHRHHENTHRPVPFHPLPADHLLSIVEVSRGKYQIFSSDPSGYGAALCLLKKRNLDTDIMMSLEESPEKTPRSFAVVDSIAFYLDRKWVLNIAYELSRDIPNTALYLWDNRAKKSSYQRTLRPGEDLPALSYALQVIDYEDEDRTWFFGHPDAVGELVQACEAEHINIVDMDDAWKGKRVSCMAVSLDDAGDVLFLAHRLEMIPERHTRELDEEFPGMTE